MALSHPRTGLQRPRPTSARSGWRVDQDGDRPKRSDPFVAVATADPQFRFRSKRVKRGDGTAGTNAGRRCGAGGPVRQGCWNAYESVGSKELVVQRLCGLWAAPRNGGGDGVPIELPAGGAELLHCREKRGLSPPKSSVDSHSMVKAAGRRNSARLVSTAVCCCQRRPAGAFCHVAQLFSFAGQGA